MTEYYCENCGSYLASVRTLHDEGTVQVCELRCSCGRGMRSTYHPREWAGVK